jgi:hypothetical protein
MMADYQYFNLANVPLGVYERVGQAEARSKKRHGTS